MLGVVMDESRLLDPCPRHDLDRLVPAAVAPARSWPSFYRDPVRGRARPFAADGPNLKLQTLSIFHAMAYLHT